jgi:uncharacterized protein (UPF0332 family)
LLPRDLLKTADDLINSANNKPRQANLLRATSTIYYALFYTLARCCADLLIGGSSSKRSKHAWKQTYRALEHGLSKKCCQHPSIQKFPQEIQDFADMFVVMQEKRHRADYDPDEKAYKSSVSVDLQSVKKVLLDFSDAPIEDRRAFAAFVIMKRRN